MTYTYVDLVSNELNGLEIGTTTFPSINVVKNWIEDADAEINLRTGKVWSSTLATSSYVDYDGSGYLRLPYAPVINVSSLQYENQGLGADSENWTALTEGRTNDYILYVMDGEIQFLGSSLPPKGQQNICITYAYGYANTPVYITRLATLLVAKRCIMATINSSAQGEGGSVTVGNISITDPSQFSVNYIRSMNQEIDDIYERIGQVKVFRPSRVYDLRY
jgi:hypothetical protein